MGFIEEYDRRRKEALRSKEPEEKLSTFEMNVQRMEVIMEIASGNREEVMEIVTLWVDEAKRRYDQQH